MSQLPKYLRSVSGGVRSGTLSPHFPRTEWMANVELVANSKAAESNIDWELGLNEFADMAPEEFAGRMNGYVSRGHLRPKNNNVHKISGAAAPTSVDWRTKGLVTDVKNQGSCGSW